METNNYYPQRDGRIPELDSQQSTSSELLQRHLADSSVVKAFNNIYFGVQAYRPTYRRTARLWR